MKRLLLLGLFALAACPDNSSTKGSVQDANVVGPAEPSVIKPMPQNANAAPTAPAQSPNAKH